MNLPKILSGSRNPVEAAFSRVNDLDAQRSKLADRLTAAVSRVDAAQATRRAALIDTDPDAATMNKLDKACADAAEARLGIEEASRHVAEHLTEAQSTYAGLVAAAARAKVIAECQLRAAAVDAAAERLADAARIFSDARLELVAAIEEHGMLVPNLLAVGGSLSAVTLVQPIIMAAVRAAAPSVLPSADGFGKPHEADVIVAAKRAQSGRLRDHADAIRDGASPIEAPERPRKAREAIRVPLEEAGFILRTGIQYTGAFGSPVVIGSGPGSIPGPVAEAAFAANLGAWPGTPASAEVMKDLERKALSKQTGLKAGSTEKAPLALPVWVRLDFDLGAWVEAEQARIAAVRGVA